MSECPLLSEVEKYVELPMCTVYTNPLPLVDYYLRLHSVLYRIQSALLVVTGAIRAVLHVCNGFTAKLSFTPATCGQTHIERLWYY